MRDERERYNKCEKKEKKKKRGVARRGVTKRGGAKRGGWEDRTGGQETSTTALPACEVTRSRIDVNAS